MASTDSVQSSNNTNRMALIIVGVLALLGLAYAIARVDILRARIATLEVDRDQQQGFNGLLQAKLDELTLANTNTTEQLKQLAQLQNELGNLNASLGELRGRTEQSQRNWARIEALYLLRLADDQLKLAQDVPTAIAALESAKGRLDSTRDSALDNVRAQLAVDLQALRNVPQADLPGIYAQLIQAEQQSATLKIAGTVVNDNNANQSPEEMQAGLERAWSMLKRTLTQLVTVRKTATDAADLITSDEQTLRRRHLQLLLLAARQAAQIRDSGSYRDAVQDALRWLNTAFDMSDNQVKALRDKLQTLSKQEIAPALPDISGSRRILERYAPAIAGGES